ncbi:MAG: hypothetical protein IJX16_04510 [Clostridia bacterium]|nr:hypothetical protein [Clostridia bacterium]
MKDRKVEEKTQPEVQNDSTIVQSAKDVKVEKPVKQIKNVSVKQCFKTIFLSLIALCVAFIPITFGNVGINMTYQALPIISDGSIAEIQVVAAEGFSLLVGSDVSAIIANALNIGTIAYFGILVANIVFSLLLIFTRSQILRIIFKVYTIIAGFAMICILLLSIVHIVGVSGFIIKGVVPIEEIMSFLETSAILTMLGMAIMSGVNIGKQFRWFERLY